MPVFKTCAAKLAADAIDVCDELSLLSALAEYLLIRPGINVADKASAVNVSVARDFFMVGILILSLTLSEKQARPVSLKGGKDIYLPRVNETNYTSGNSQSLPVSHRLKYGESGELCEL